MASVGVSAAAAAYSWNPFLAAGAIAIASYIDQQYLYPSLVGDPREKAKPRPLAQLPQTTTSPGTPRVWTLGRRTRVPVHVFYQSSKTREQNIGGRKGGVPQQIRRVFADLGIVLNDRRTSKLTQLAANGQLIYFTEKNLFQVVTDQVTCSTPETVVATGTVAAGSTASLVLLSSGGAAAYSWSFNYLYLKITSGALAGQMRPINSNDPTYANVSTAFTAAPIAGVTYGVVSKPLVLQLNTTYERDFSEVFERGDIVRLKNYTASTNTLLYGTGIWSSDSWWTVQEVTSHTAVPSKLVLQPAVGQNTQSLSGVTAGSALTPGIVEREDTVFLVPDAQWDTFGPTDVRAQPNVNAGAGYIWEPDVIAKTGNRVCGTSVSVPVKIYNFFGITSGASATLNSSGRLVVPGSVPPLEGVGWNFAFIAKRISDPSFEPGMFAVDPSNNFYDGSDAQLEDDIIARTKTSGEIPGFRGMCYVVLDQWDLSTYFGNQVPPIVEAIIEPDSLMTLPQAILEVCERAQSQDLKFDTQGVNSAPFEGYWTQGAIPTVTALQPIMTAYQVAAQERNDTLVFFNIENADSVQIENGATFSDLGVTSGAGTPFAGDKIKITQRDVADLPTSIGVTHQDPDQQYSQGYQHFKQRQPSPLPSANEQNVNLDNLVLSRKQARNLAGTIMRRAWVNSTALEFQLPVAYMELLENDLVTLTSYEDETYTNGQDFTARIIRREVGNNFVLNVYAVVEDVALAVRGSPVQGPSDIVIGTPDATDVTARILDVPPLVDGDAFVPGYYVGGSSPSWQGAIVYESRDGGSNWNQVATLNTQCGMGLTTTSLASGTPGDGIGSVTYDTVNSFTVAVDNIGPTGFLVTVTEPDVEAGLNWMLVEDGANWEILGARDVVDNGDGTYTFDHLLRGLRGTYDSAATTKAAGSKVTFLYLARNQGALQFVPVNLSASSLPSTIQVKVVASGQALIDVTAETVTLDCWNARPMPGKMFGTEYDISTTDRTFNFENWTRLSEPVGQGGPFNLDESFEGYAVRIYDPTGVTLLRTKTITSQTTGTNRIRGDRSVPYPAAEQTADGYTPGPTETFKVERVQLGDFGEGRTWMEDV